MANFDKMEYSPPWNNLKTPGVKERMQDLYETKRWADCVFKLRKSEGKEEELVFAHNLILASSSPVFEALCFGPMAEKNPIEIPDIDPFAFRMMLKFIYTESIEFTCVETACNILYASKKYLIYSLAGLAISYISCHINETNCLEVYNFSNFVQEDKLINDSWTYLCSHLDDVLKYFSYESLTIDLVKKLVNEESLNGGEIIIYKICLMWAEAECNNNNLEKNSQNLRKVLIQANLLNKIRLLTFTIKEFEEGPQKSGILTDDEVSFVSKIIKLLNCGQPDDCTKNIDRLLDPKGVLIDAEYLHLLLQEGEVFSSSISYNVEMRKRIQLKKFYCHRFIEKEITRTLDPNKELKIRTCIIANKSVRLTAIFLNAKKLLTTDLSHYFIAPKDYTEKLLVNICDSLGQTLFYTLFHEKLNYGTVLKIPLSTPVILERSKEYTIQIDLLNSAKNYLFGVRNSISKFPSGLSVTFQEQANLGENQDFVIAQDLSIISGLELCL